MNDRDERDTDPAPAPHLVCSVCRGSIAEEPRQPLAGCATVALVHAIPVCAPWREHRAIALDPDLYPESKSGKAT